MASLWPDRWNVWESPRTHHGPCIGLVLMARRSSPVKIPTIAWGLAPSLSISPLPADGAVGLCRHTAAIALTRLTPHMPDARCAHASGLLGGCSRDGGKVRLTPTGKVLEITLIGGSSIGKADDALTCLHIGVHSCAPGLELARALVQR